SFPTVFAACAFLLASAPAAAVSFSARLSLPDERPAAGYVVSVVGQPGSVLCDREGRFTLDPAPQPPFSLVASGPNGEVSAPYEIASLSTGPIEISLPPVARDSVTVVSGVAPTLDTLPASAPTVVTLEELEQRAPQRLYQALESVAGASKLGDGADSAPSLRGMARGRTLILLDGARVSAERRVGPSASFVEPESLAAVEVVRGPGSVVYGSDVFGGVINAVTRDPEPGAFGACYGVEASAGALDQQAAFVAASAAVAGGHLLLEGHWRTADDAEAGDDVPIFNSSLDGKGGAARFVRDVGPGRLRLAVAVDRMEDVGKAAIDSRVNTSSYPDESSDRFTASWLGTPGSPERGGWESVESALFYGKYHILLERDRFPPAVGAHRVESTDNDAKDGSFRLVGARELGGGRLQLGADAWSRFDLHAISGRIDFNTAGVGGPRTPIISVDDARQLTTGVFGTWSRPLASSVSLGLGARVDRVTTRNEGGVVGDRRETYTPLSGNAALTFGPYSGWTTTAQLSRGFRSPSLSDRYFSGPSGRGTVTGNPDLDPETSLQLDLASRWSHGRSTVALYAYRYEIDDLIERFGVGDNFAFRNRGQATLEGLEVEAQTAIGARWSAELGAAWSDGETDDGAEIDDITPPNGWATLRWAFDRGYAFGRVTTFLPHEEPGPTELERPGFTVLDLGGGWRFSEALELRLTVRNATDKLYVAAPDNAADFAVGRSITLALGGKL
ncbi:MAG TPA: TonB-dependent receptor, partial [Thermoanaerobaculia bacterium]|nr:TonB-dependent receptor [Thermoanaerobaculia bacterium]